MRRKGTKKVEGFIMLYNYTFTIVKVCFVYELKALIELHWRRSIQQ
jgi:hypothetical protein